VVVYFLFLSLLIAGQAHSTVLSFLVASVGPAGLDANSILRICAYLVAFLDTKMW